MSTGADDLARRALLALADVTPSGEQRTAGLSIPTEWFTWLDAESVRVFIPFPDGGGGRDDSEVRFAAVEQAFGERLASVDQLRPEQRSLRVGWLFVAGRVDDGSGRIRRVFHPLVTLPVRVQRAVGWGPARLVPAGDVEITGLVADADERHRLEEALEIGGGGLSGLADPAIPQALLVRLDRLQRFARAAAAAAGLPATAVVPAGAGPEELVGEQGLVIVAGVGVFATHGTTPVSRAGSLRAWAAGSLPGPTAFHALYVDDASPVPDGPEQGAPVASPFLLTPAQRAAVVRSRREPVTVISGAPGTGKSHTVVAIACDVLAQGGSVLVAAKSDATVDALLDLLERAPGPDPVVFGSNERREALAERLGAGQLQPAGDAEVRRAREASDAARARLRTLRSRIADDLRAEDLVVQAGGATDGARRAAPGLFDPETDLGEVAQLLDAASAPVRGWWKGRRRRRARRTLLELARGGDLPLEVVTQALRTARASRAAARLEAAGGLDIGRTWVELRDLDDRARDAAARWLAAESRSEARLNRSTLPAVAGLATALRSGRAARRVQLGRLGHTLTRALPLWVGTLADIDDLLPAVTGLFDLVVLDEASSIDQPLAAPALLRADRAVVVGDPQQLRHVSFLSDARLAGALAAHGLEASPLLAARLDVRRNSTFDVAAGVSPVIVLDEHFRSDPHLVEFVARNLYGGRVQVATRAPTTTSKDCVTVVRLEGERDERGVVPAEVDRALREAVRLRRAGVTSVGLVTPFRAQADALEEAALRTFTLDDLEALDLRVGTVHAFQGNERDVVVASLGVGSDSGAGSWRFVEDPHLFTVLVTRARRRMTVLVSADPPPQGLVAAYLAQADSPPGDPPPSPPASPFAAAVAGDLAAAGAPVLPSYPTGRHVVDIAAGSRGRDVAIHCGVHPDGADAHIERHLALVRSGWDVVEAFPSRWSSRRGELVVELLGVLGS